MSSATPYTRIRRLAVGGMGEIYLARRGAGEATELVILKSLLPQAEGGTEAARMFAEEARLLELLRHENIIRVHEVFEEKGEPVIAMEYVDGESLAVLVRAATTSARHEIDPFVHIIAQAAQGLHAAHGAVDANGRSLRLVHRDVSPQNIMVNRRGVVKVLDFGIAKTHDSPNATRTGSVKGKLAYMSPEQLACQPLDARCDIYALGVVLWEATVGQRAFNTKSDVELLTQLTTSTIPLPTTVASTYPPALEAVVMKALAKDPAARYQSGAEMSQALSVYLSTRPLLTRTAVGKYVEALVGVDLERRRSGEAVKDTPSREVTANEPQTSTAVVLPQGLPRVVRQAPPPVKPTSDSASTVFPVAAEASLFEGLFRGVSLSEAARADLLKIGVDTKRLESKYRVDVWARTIEVVRRHVYPDVAPDEASRRLGYDFSKGFEQTIGGRMVLAVLPILLSPPSLLAKVPRFFKLGRPDIDISWQAHSKTTGTLRVKDVAQVSPYFDVGLIHYIIERMGAKAQAKVEWHSLVEFSIHYEW